MSDDKRSTDLIDKILFEASAYRNFSDIERLVDNGADLSAVPVQPLYVALQSASTELITKILPKLSKEQRKALLDIDIWEQDSIDPANFGFWVESYVKCESDAIAFEFAHSDDFLLLLKSRLNIYTFDVEEPEYPDHDNYFLTDDGLLLIEYDDTFTYREELKFLILRLYSELGVEKAYAHLFKMVVDSYMIWEEDAYQQKKERLRDFGFVDSYEARQLLFPFATNKQMNGFIKNKKAVTGAIDSEVFNQTLHSKSVQRFDTGLSSVHEEAEKLNNELREQYVQFSFVRMINSTMALSDGLKSSSLELSRQSEETKSYLELGCQYTVEQLGQSEKSIFEAFDFFDLYRIGKTLVESVRGDIRKQLKLHSLEGDLAQNFLGVWFNQFIEDAFQSPPKAKSFGAGLEAKEVRTLTVFKFWERSAKQLTDLVPFIKGFYDNFLKLKKDELLQDDYYLNFNVSELDFECILITSFVNFSLGELGDGSKRKMGLTSTELSSFIELCFRKVGTEYMILPETDEKVSKVLTSFTTTFGLNEVEGAQAYIYGILGEHLNGYEWDTMEIEDFKHVGGVILLSEK